jgi:hypothetical protein
MTPQVARRPWPANRRGTVYQIDSESLLAEFTREAEDLFTQVDDLDVTIVDMKNGAVCRNIKCTNMDEILQYIQVLYPPSDDLFSQLTPPADAERKIYNNHNVRLYYSDIILKFC